MQKQIIRMDIKKSGGQKEANATTRWGHFTYRQSKENNKNFV